MRSLAWASATHRLDLASALSEPSATIQPETRRSGIANERQVQVSTYITGVRMSPSTANDHEHISEVRWGQPGKSNAVYVHGSPDGSVGVVCVMPPYLRTHADGNWTNNLLSLPRF
jgi:hypothetical protein